nr:MAG TPA: hypothetical protein [Caudoviricetes sp.]
MLISVVLPFGIVVALSYKNRLSTGLSLFKEFPC